MRKMLVVLSLTCILGIAAIVVSGMSSYGYYNWGGTIGNAGVDAWAYPESGLNGAAARAVSGNNSSGWRYGQYVSASVWVWPWSSINRYHYYY